MKRDFERKRVQEAIVGGTPSDSYQRKDWPLQELTDHAVRIEEFKE